MCESYLPPVTVDVETYLSDGLNRRLPYPKAVLTLRFVSYLRLCCLTAHTSHAGGILMTSRLGDENKRAESISPRAHCAASRLAGRSTWPSNFFRQFLSLLDVQVVLRG